MKLLIENVRSFAKHHAITVKPLTLLVGENSSGKSTFLALLSAVSDRKTYPGSTSLNKAPYDLGAFDTIATYKGGKAGRAKQFGLGFSLENDNLEPATALAKYSAHHGETKLCSFSFKTRTESLSLQWSDGRLTGELTGMADVPTITLGQDLADPTVIVGDSLPLYLLQSITKEQRTLMSASSPFIDRIFSMAQKVTNSLPQVASISPIRSTPKRTYDLISEEYDPGGDHIPFVLAKILEETAKTKSQEALLATLNKFGADSGLYKALVSKRLGHQAGSPFQINVKIAGPSFNLRDVGYGVSQSLPIIVQSVLKSTAARMLLQQPEVHLHPRAQAAMGSFVAALVGQKKKEFVIETHSDYLIDRIRQDVAKGILPPEDVLILFFHKPHIDTKVFELHLDGSGNIQNAPSQYRRFFLEEELSLFNRASECV